MNRITVIPKFFKSSFYFLKVIQNTDIIEFRFRYNFYFMFVKLFVTLISTEHPIMTR